MLVVLIDRTPTCEWYIARHVINNKQYKDMYHDEIELCAKLDIILSSIVAMFETINAV